MSSRCCREFVSEVMATVGSRLVAAGQAFRGRSQRPPEPAIPRLPCARLLHLQQRPLNSDVDPHIHVQRRLGA